MFPLSDNALSLREISRYWSREIKPSASVLELLIRLESAWWRGELVAETALTRLNLLRHLFKSTYDSGLVFVVDDQSSQPEIKELPDGNVQVDLSPIITVPCADTEVWNDANCALAYESLAGTPLLVDDPVIGPVLSGIKLTHETFIKWLILKRYPLPTFWGTIEANDDVLLSAQAESTPEQRSKRGSRSGSGWDKADVPLIAEMDALIKSGNARSANDAARQVAKRAKGDGTLESKQTRLRKAYRRRFGE
jgi:hypothetical protein